MRSVIVVAVMGSRPVVGSSYSMMRGRATSARATATRRRWPPESSAGMRSPKSCQAHEAQHLVHAALDLTFVQLAVFHELEGHVLAHGDGVEERAFLEHHPDLQPDVAQLLFAQVRDLARRPRGCCRCPASKAPG